MTTDHDSYTPTPWGRVTLEVVRYPGRTPWERPTYCVQVWDAATNYGTPAAEAWDNDPNVAAATALGNLDLANTDVMGDDLEGFLALG